MKVCHYSDVKPSDETYAPGVALRWVIGEADGAPHFAMRVIDVAPGAATQHHDHWWEHEVFVVSGRGCVISEEGSRPLGEGTVIYIEGDETHQIVNDGDEVLRFVCLIPHPRLKGIVEALESEALPDQC